jgi:hypothetical protein
VSLIHREIGEIREDLFENSVLPDLPDLVENSVLPDLRDLPVSRSP